MISQSEGLGRKGHYREKIMSRGSKQQACVRTVELNFPAEGEGPLAKDLKMCRADQNGKLTKEI